MTGKLLAGAAGIAMIVASGAASAADIPPLGAEAEVDTGPKISVIAEATAVGIIGSGSSGVILLGGAGVDAKFNSGLGVSFVAQAFGIPTGPIAVALAEGRVYYMKGPFEVGFAAIIAQSFPVSGSPGFQFGPDFGYEGERFSVTNTTRLLFPGGFDGWENETEITFTPNERVKVMSNIFLSDYSTSPLGVDVTTSATIKVAPHFELVPGAFVSLDTTGAFDFALGVEARAPLGAVTPFVALDWSPGSFDVTLGADLEKHLGTGPFTLRGTAQFIPDLSGGGNHAFLAGIGIRYQLGDDPPDFFFDLFDGTI